MAQPKPITSRRNKRFGATLLNISLLEIIIGQFTTWLVIALGGITVASGAWLLLFVLICGFFLMLIGHRLAEGIWRIAWENANIWIGLSITIGIIVIFGGFAWLAITGDEGVHTALWFLLTFVGLFMIALNIGLHPANGARVKTTSD